MVCSFPNYASVDMKARFTLTFRAHAHALAAFHSHAADQAPARAGTNGPNLSKAVRASIEQATGVGLALALLARADRQLAEMTKVTVSLDESSYSKLLLISDTFGLSFEESARLCLESRVCEPPKGIEIVYKQG